MDLLTFTYMQNTMVKGQVALKDSENRRTNRQTDTVECITIPANAVGDQRQLFTRGVRKVRRMVQA